MKDLNMKKWYLAQAKHNILEESLRRHCVSAWNYYMQLAKQFRLKVRSV